MATAIPSCADAAPTHPHPQIPEETLEMRLLHLTFARAMDGKRALELVKGSSPAGSGGRRVLGRELEVREAALGASVWAAQCPPPGLVVPTSLLWLQSISFLPLPGPSGPPGSWLPRTGGTGLLPWGRGEFLNLLEASTRGLCAPLRPAAPVVSGALEPVAEAEPPPQSQHPLGPGRPEGADGCLGDNLC